MAAVVTRIAGPDRFATAAQVTSNFFPDGLPEDFRAVLIASGQNFPDALGLAAFGATAPQNPLLLVSADQLPAATAAEIARLAPDEIVVAGGRAAVGDAVIAELQRIAPVRRWAGTNRFATAAAIATEGLRQSDAIVLATGANFPDALTAGVLGLPLLLSAEPLPPDTALALGQMRPGHLLVAGGPGAVSDTAIAAAAAAVDGTAPGAVQGLPVPSTFRIRLTGQAGAGSAANPFVHDGTLVLAPTVPPENASPNGENPVDVAMRTDVSPVIGATGALFFGTNVALTAELIDDNRPLAPVDIAFVSAGGGRVDIRVDGDVFGQPTARIGYLHIYNTTTSIVAQVHNVLAGDMTLQVSEDGERIEGSMTLLGSSGFTGPAFTSHYQATFSGVRAG